MRSLFILFVVMFAVACGRNIPSYLPETRSIIVRNDSVIVHANTYTTKRDVKVKNGLTYYWHYAENIECNQGGYFGSLLHGEYSVLSVNNQLLQKGGFSDGLKNGMWMYWNTKGDLVCTEKWNMGRLTKSRVLHNDIHMVDSSVVENQQLAPHDTVQHKNGWFGRFFKIKSDKTESNETVAQDTLSY